MIKNIPYNKQSIDNKDSIEVLKSLKERLITTGKYVLKYENKIKKILKSNYALSCSSGTSAIPPFHVSNRLKRNDVVIIPAINFIASYSVCKMMVQKFILPM